MRKGVLAAAGGALLAASITWNTAQAVPISAPAALKDASQSIALTDNVHYYGYGYGYRPYYRPYRPYYGGYGYGYRPYYGALRIRLPALLRRRIRLPAVLRRRLRIRLPAVSTGYGGYGYGYRPYYGGGYGYGYYAPRPRFYVGPSVYGY